MQPWSGSIQYCPAEQGVEREKGQKNPAIRFCNPISFSFSRILTALPFGVAHLEVAAGSCRVLAGTVGAAELLDLLAQALQGAVHLEVAIADNVSVISTEHTEGIGGLLLGLGDEAEVESAAGGTRCSSRSGRTRRTLKRKEVVISMPVEALFHMLG